MQKPQAAPISVIITCFNLERYIADAIESVRTQHVTEKFEIIVVDDCSTDSSPEQIRKFGDVRYIRHERNRGVLSAMFSGVDAAAGDIICLLDGDDVWHSNKLQRTFEAFSDPKVAFVTHDLRYMDSHGRPFDRPSRPRAALSQLPTDKCRAEVRRGILELTDYVWLGSAFSFRRSAIDWEGFRRFADLLPDPANTYQDWPLAYWIAAQPELQMAYIDQPLFDYRLHSANYSGDASTLERARRNFRRTRNTIAAMHAIALQRPLADVARVKRHLRLAEGQLALYEGRRFAALKAYSRSVSHLARRGMLPREVARLVTGVLLGPRCLVWISEKLRAS